MARKTSERVSIAYEEALEVALSYGWIDSQARSEDEDYRLQKFTPRAKRSLWSKRNRDRALALIESGRMRPAGLAEIERARADGRWDAAYDPPRHSEVPPDLALALSRNPKAQRFFARLDGRNRYAILFRLQTAKKEDTRRKRIDRFVAMLARHETIHR
jgi:uncharacterized protein YdeI (YjbR/CyaY-like superfamily)